MSWSKWLKRLTELTGNRRPKRRKAQADPQSLVAIESLERRTLLSGVASPDESPVNQTVVGTQQLSDSVGPTIAAAADGRLVVTWEARDPTTNQWDIFARRYHADGTANGDEFRVNTHTLRDQRNPTVAVADNGEFLITWQSRHPEHSERNERRSASFIDFDEAAEHHKPLGVLLPIFSGVQNLVGQIAPDYHVSDALPFGHAQLADGWRIVGQRFSAKGERLGDEFQISTDSYRDQVEPSATFLPDGNIAVVWSGAGHKDHSGVFMRLFDESGNPLTEEYRVNETRFGKQSHASITTDSTGELVVVWSGHGIGDFSGVFARQFNADGTAKGKEFLVNESAGGYREWFRPQRAPAVTADTTGGFAVAWEGTGTGDKQGVFLRRFDSSGRPLTSEKLANETTYGRQGDVSIITTPEGFALAWEGKGSGDSKGIFTREFDRHGSPISGERRANPKIGGKQSNPGIVWSNGSLTVAWSGRGEGDRSGVFLRSYNRPPTLDPIGNREIDEQQELTFTASATDPDLPEQTLTFSLHEGAPEGAVIDPVSGVFRWTPGEEDGPGSFDVTVRVTDDSGANDFETITIDVAEVNRPPELNPIGDKEVDEQQELTFTASATDPDLPEQTLTFSLDEGAPDGAMIDPISGVFRWTPTEEDGPGSFDVTIRVTDDAGTSDFETITIEVIEPNESPELAPIDSIELAPGDSVNIQPTATDPNLPNDSLTWTPGAGFPDWLAIAPTTGLITGTVPLDANLSEELVAVRVTDAGDLFDVGTFTLTVVPLPEVAIEPISDQLAITGQQLAVEVKLTNTEERRSLRFELEDDGASNPTDVIVQQTGKATALIRWTPQLADVGQPVPFRVIVTESQRDEPLASEQFYVTVSALSETIVLAEGASFRKSVSVPVEPGQLEGKRTLAFNVEAAFDDSDSASVIEDIFQVFLVDSSAPQRTLLDNGLPGTAVFSLAGDKAEFLPGLVRYDGTRVEIDTTSLSVVTDATLIFQLINSDNDNGTQVAVGPVSVINESGVPAAPVLQAGSGGQASGGPVDLTDYTVAPLVEVVARNIRFDEATGIYTAEIAVRNNGPAIGKQVAVALTGLPHDVTVLNPSGTDDNGNPYFNLASVIGDGGLDTGSTSRFVTVEVSNLDESRFKLVPTVLSAGANSAPTLPVIPPIVAVPGDHVELQLAGQDLDGDKLTYTLRSSQSLPGGKLTSDGRLIFEPAPGDEGRYDFTVVVSDGINKAEQPTSLTIEDDPDTTTRFSGQILNTNSAPLSGMVIEVRDDNSDVLLTTTTDAAGNFALNGPAPVAADTIVVRGDLYVSADAYPFIAEKIPLVTGHDVYQGAKNVVYRPIYLPALDVAGGTQIDPAVDTTVQQEIAPGQSASVFVEAGSLKTDDGSGNMVDFTGVLSITEVPVDLTPAALPVNLVPDTVVTIQPGEMIFTAPAELTLPNRSGFAPGTIMDLWSINPETGDFDKVGQGLVTPDGQFIETISGGINNSSWHFFAPPAPEVQPVTPIEEDPNCGCGGGKSTASFSSEVELHSGALRESHDLVTYQSLGQTRGLQLYYNSLHADPQPVVSFGYDNIPVNDDRYLVAELELMRGQFAYELPGFAGGQGLGGGQHFWKLPEEGGSITAALQVPLQDVPTGTYDYTIRTGLYLRGDDGRFAGASSETVGKVYVANLIDSAFGAGWSLAGQQSIIENPDGSVLLLNGAGTRAVFEASDTSPGRFVSPPADFSVLEKLSDGTFRRTLTDQTVYQFNADHQLATMTDRNGLVTQWRYDLAGNLTHWIDPAGLETRFIYIDQHVSSIVDPAGRTTSFQYDGDGNLNRITDPDGTTREFGYDLRHRMTSETDQAGAQEQVFYGEDGRVIRSIRKDGSERRLLSAQSAVLVSPEFTSDPDTAPVASTIDAAIGTFADSDGSTEEVLLDRFGQTVEQSDSDGLRPTTIRNDNNQIIRTIDARGNPTSFAYDDRGNLTTIEESLGFEFLSDYSQVAVQEFDQSSGTRDTPSGSFLDSHVVTGHFSSDDILDVAIAGSSTIQIFEGVGDGTFAAPATLFSSAADPPSYKNLVAVDFNNDGFTDLVAADGNSHNIISYLGTSDGMSADGTAIAFAPVGTTLNGLTLGDLNGDGTPDLIGTTDAEVGSGETVVLGFAAPTVGFLAILTTDVQVFDEITLELATVRPLAISTGDIDGDDVDELFVVGLPPQNENPAPPGLPYTIDSVIRWDNILAEFELLYSTVGYDNHPETSEFGITKGDVDGDGLNEFLITSEFGSTDVIFSYESDGTLIIDRRPVLASHQTAAHIALIDTNRDQILDLILADVHQQTLVAAGNVNGEFEAPRPATFEMLGSGDDVVVGDFDGDTLPEIVRLYHGGGRQQFLVTFDQDATEETATTFFTYDEEFNQLTSQTDGLGRLTLYELDDATGNVELARQVVGAPDDEINGETDDRVTQVTYTQLGLVDTATDPLGRITDFDYDVLGRLTTITYALGTVGEAVESFEYDAAGNQIAAIDANGNRTEFQYDEMNRLVRIKEPDPDGIGPLSSAITDFSYDARGNLATTTDARGNTTVNEHDVLDRLLTTTDANNQATRYGYDMAGNLAMVVDPLGFRTRNRYDGRGRLVESIDPEGGVTRFGYDFDDNLTLLIDPVGNETRFRYDARDRLIEEIDPLGAVTTYAYDAADNLIRKTDRNDRITEFEYDELDRLVLESWVAADGTTIQNTISYKYDKVGNLLNVDDDFSELTFTYDARDRVNTVDNGGTPDAPNVVLTYGYDGVGNVTSVTDTIGGGAGATASYGYDALNRTVFVQQTGNEVSDKLVDFVYNELGQFDEIIRYADLSRTALVARSDYEYDELNRLTDLDHTNSANEVLAFYDFEYDPSSRITQITDIDGVTDYSYDDRSQLTGVDRNAMDVRGDESYEYDANGNRVSSHRHGDGYETGAANRLDSDGTHTYEYDAEGNMVKRTQITTGAYREFAWDHRNRLTRVTDFDVDNTATQIVGFTYDALGRRITKLVDADGDGAEAAGRLHFIYDRNNVILDYAGKSDPVDAMAVELDQRYLYGPGVDQVLAQEGQYAIWLLADLLGTTRDLVGSDGRIEDHLQFDSFGAPVRLSDRDVQTRYVFTGREYDRETGLLYSRARYYDPLIGQFTGDDPLGLRDSSNLKTYTANDPVNFFDSNGTIRLSAKGKQFDVSIVDPQSGISLDPNAQKSFGIFGEFNALGINLEVQADISVSLIDGNSRGGTVVIPETRFSVPVTKLGGDILLPGRLRRVILALRVINGAVTARELENLLQIDLQKLVDIVAVQDLGLDTRPQSCQAP